VLQAGPRCPLAEVPLVAGARVVAVAPPRPSGSGLVVLVVVARAGLVSRCTARWILGTSGIG
jgi:hypothetical protein